MNKDAKIQKRCELTFGHDWPDIKDVEISEPSYTKKPYIEALFNTDTIEGEFKKEISFEFYMRRGMKYYFRNDDQKLIITLTTKNQFKKGDLIIVEQ